MKIPKFLTICFLVCCLFSGSVFAACGNGLFDVLFPNGDYFLPGDVIEYEVALSIPNQPELYCTLTNLEIYFFPPNQQTGDACDDPNGVLIYQTAVFAPGDSDFVTSASTAIGTEGILSYVVDPLDVVEGNKLIAKYCIKFELDGEPDVKSATVVNRLFNPAVCVTKEPDCDETIVGENVYWTIMIENCGDTELDLNYVDDSLYGDLTSLASGCTPLVPDANCTFQVGPYLVTGADNDPLINVVDVNYFVVGTSLMVSDSDNAEIDIVDTNFTVDKECQTPEVFLGNDANFLITVENTGDVTLDFTSSELGAFSLIPDEIKQVIVTKTATACPTVDNQVSVTGSYTGGTEDCLYWEDTRSSDLVSCGVIDPQFTVEKVCLTDPVTDANAVFEITITNTTTCGDIDLDFEYTDPAAGILDPEEVGPLAPGEDAVIQVEVPADCVDNSVSNTVYVEGFYGDISVGTDEAIAICPCGGEEGCTPGYWKNSPNCWACYSPETLLNTVFDFSGTPTLVANKGNKTMLQALAFKGGPSNVNKLRLLLRHATAAILNACSGNVEYPDSVAGIVEDVNYILANWDTVTKDEILDLKNQFKDWNEEGCPLNSQNSAYPCQRTDEVVNGF